MSLINRGKLKRATSQDEEPDEEGDELSKAPGKFITCIKGVGKAVRGIVATVPALLLGVCGVGPQDTYGIINSPVGDWWQLAKTKIKEVNEKRGWGERIGRGFLGLITGSVTGAFNGLKDVLAGGFQVFGGGIWILKKLKDLGLPPEVMNTILKTGNPLGYLAQASGVSLDALNKIYEKLHKDLSKFKSFGEFADKVKGELAKNADIKSLMDNASGVGQGLADGLGGEIGNRLKDGLKTVGGQLDNIKSAAQKMASKGMDLKKQIATVYESVARDLPNIQQSLQDKLGISKALIQAEKNAILIKGENAAQGVKQLLADKASKFSGMVAKASSKEGIIAGLVKTGDPELINKLAVVKITARDGSERTLSRAEVSSIISEAQEKLKGVKGEAELQAADRADRAWGATGQVERGIVDATSPVSSSRSKPKPGSGMS